MDQVVIDVVEKLLDDVVENEIRANVDALVEEEEKALESEQGEISVEEDASKNEMENGEEENGEEEEEQVEQIGGARVKLLSRKNAGGRFQRYVEHVKLLMELQPSVTVSPNGAEEFAKMVEELIQRYTPSSANGSTKVGVTFTSPELNNGEGTGLSLTPLDKVNPTEIVRNMELMSQSSRSPLEIQSPRLEVVLLYVTPPVGTGIIVKRNRNELYSMEHVLEMNTFGKRRRSNNDDEDGGILGGSNFIDGCIEDDEEEEYEDEDEEEEIGSKRRERANVMKNNVTRDCLPHALFQAHMYNEQNHGATDAARSRGRSMYRMSEKIGSSKRDSCGAVFKAVEAMKNKAGVTKSKDFDVVDIEKFQEKVFGGTHQIIVIVKHQKTPYYSGPYVGENKILPIYLDDENEGGHYYGVRKLPALLGSRYYCCYCNVRFGGIADHYNCPLRHRACGATDCVASLDDAPVECSVCTGKFRSQQCYENHVKKGRRNGKSRCQHTKKCRDCGELYYTNKSIADGAHECFTKWCERCQVRRPNPHNCIMRESKKNEKKLTRKRIYYDFESRAEKDGEQIPVLFVALRCCSQCSTSIPTNLRDAEAETCSNCAPDGRCKVIECITEDNLMVDVALEATEWMFEEHHKGFVALAHNVSGYDGHFFLKNLVSSMKAAPQIVTAGTKLIYLRHRNVTLIDSLKYLTMSLAAVGKAFQIPVQKGDFPILFIKPENYDYNGVLPDDEFYNLENKKPADKAKILLFLNEQRSKKVVFNFIDEIKKYCYSDVFILTSALSVFEKDFEEMTDVCLFEESTTAASAAIKVFQRNHLNADRPIVLDARPSVSVNSSAVSQKFLAWLGESEGIQVETSTTYGERKVAGYRVDGFVESCAKYPRGLVIEFFGCYWHGHKCRYSKHSVIGCRQVSEIRLDDAKRIGTLAELHDVKVVWECEVKEELKNNPEMADFFEDYVPLDLLHCEKALVGGRTEVFRLHAEAEEKSLEYGDVVSLYPTVMKHEAFPIGAPENVNRSEFNLPITDSCQLDIRGFLSCRVRPPRELKLPVLPLKIGSKLMFALCYKCAKTLCQKPCEHSDKERSFNGTFTDVELRKALSLGYVITNVYHAVRYQSWVENDQNGKGGLFTTYINQMMVEKIYASGWPTNVVSETEKKEFVKGYMEKEGIELDDFNRFSVRPGARQVSKLLLNSLWGKLAQRPDRPSTEIVNNTSRFWTLFNDTGIVIDAILCVNDVLIIRHKKQEETLKSLSTAAVHIAAFVTSYARLRLYALMEKVGGDNIIYSDTDSIVYVVPKDTENPLKDLHGPYLGQLTNELKGKMTEFVTLGPKTYCYKEEVDGEEQIVRKAKGISLTSEADKKVTFGMMKKMVKEVLDKEQSRTEVTIPQQTMKRDRESNVFCSQIEKSFRFTFNKRRIRPDGSTLPFGYCDE